MGVEEIWEPFLTEQDKAVLAASRFDKTEPSGFGSNPALLVVDVYYAALGTVREPITESVKRWPMSCGLEGWDAVDRTVPLLSAARDNGVPVVFLKRFTTFPSPWMRPGPLALDGLSPEERAMAGEIVEELAPRSDELVLEKAAASAFAGTPLEFHLRALGIDTVVVCGETTSGCIRATVVDAATLRYRVGVVADCCFDRTQAAHAMNLFDMHQKYGDVVRCETALRYFEAPR